ncbi:conserved hypothetical protein [Candida albicans WO-1]|uniref:Uncharacterized protein n=1 Tax=Candida albicans (strain WO-1) TaxID=294748 RepID=C4YKA3_CANAW|nr:conserved hypothetical protein [Candida albicans WO-1]
MIKYFGESKWLQFISDSSTNSSHTQDTDNFTFWTMAQFSTSTFFAIPTTIIQDLVSFLVVSQTRQHQKHSSNSSWTFHWNSDIGNLNALVGKRLNIYLIITCTIMTEGNQGFGHVLSQFSIKSTSLFNRCICSSNIGDITVLGLQVLDKLFTVS